jgi:sulfoxide reductase heme-binding subunit YedZ
MPNRWIPYVKALVHLVCLLPFLELLQQYRSGALGLMADPVNYITHQTGYWTLFLLMASLAVTPVRRLHPEAGEPDPVPAAAGAVRVLLCDAAPGDVPVSVLRLRSADGVGGAARRTPGCDHGRVEAVWPTILDDLKKRRFIQVGLFAWTLLLVLAVTSPAFW